jgi:hypothetical protein
LSIPLKPYFYYRLATIQDYQNRSVILFGTYATGTVMKDDFVYGVGRVESTSTFFPFMIMEGIAATSTSLPPPLTPPGNLAVNFDQMNIQLKISFPTSIDPEWPENPLHYEMSYSTSTSLNGTWGQVENIPVFLGNDYLIGIRASDDYGAVSKITTTTWSFPAGFAPYILSSGTDDASQYFTLSTGGELRSIQIFTANFSTGSRNPDMNGCSLSLIKNDGIGSYTTVTADNGYAGRGCAGDLTYSFASSSPYLEAGRQYQWIFQVPTGNPTTRAGVQFYGTQKDTAGGSFGDGSIVNARFIVNASSAILFAN